MELKLSLRLKLARVLMCFNRTFMELKLHYVERADGCG